MRDMGFVGALILVTLILPMQQSYSVGRNILEEEESATIKFNIQKPNPITTSSTSVALSPSSNNITKNNELAKNCPTCGLGNSNCDNVHRCTSNCGQIKSINYPLNYGNNHRCRWSIRAPDGYYVNLTIVDFDIPSSTNATKLGTCIFDYLTLVDGYTGKRLGCYCNENLPPTYIVSPWNELLIQFDTNSETTGKGFYFKYRFMRLELTEKIKKQMKPLQTLDNTTNSDNYAQSSSVCPKDWHYFRFSCYRAYNELEPLQWYDAENKCNLYAEGLDGHLVSILDEDEMLVILYLLTNVWNSTKHQDYYIGLIDGTREGLYRWSDNNPMSYTDWDLKPLLLEEETPAQPDGGAYEDCTVIRYNSFWRTSNWHDVPCSLGKHYHSHLEKVNLLLVSYNLHDYVNSYICKSDSISISSSKARRPLYVHKSPHQQVIIINTTVQSYTTNNNNYNNNSIIVPNLQNLNDINNNISLSILDDNKYFVCDNTEVISVVLKCDGVTHCRDGSDESKDCDQDCFDWQFKCANGRCISIGNYCNFVDDCGDGSDESRCERRRCNLKEFKCQSGQCIAEQKRCDLLTDCSDSTDEGKLCTIGSNCNKASTFQCYNGNCIPQYAVCDFQIDCPGKFHEDEDAATCEVILKSRFLSSVQSYNNTNSHNHHNQYNYNNHNSNQKNYQDNKQTEILTITSSISNNFYPLFYQADAEALDWAKQNLFRCRSGNLIERNLRCLYEFDRYGYQLGCRDVSHLVGCEDFECPQRDYVKCSNSYCIPWRYICDGKWDCILGDDEVGCARYVCPGQYKCANQSSCILLHQLCDGHRQCPMGDDEWFCDLQCPPSCDCIGLSVNCKGANLTFLPSNYISKSIRKLDLSYNRLGPNLSNSDFTSFHDLGELILHHNNIEVLIPRKFHTLRNLYKLDLSNNQIHSVRRGAFAGLRRVTQLLLESNPELIVLEPEAFLGLSSLQMLNISSSRILTLKKNTFDGLTSLRYLLLRNNMINEIEDNAFRSLNSLVSLDMRGNEIKVFTKLIFKDLKSLRNLSTDSFKFCCLTNNQIPADRCLPSPDEISDCEDLLSSSLQSDFIRVFGTLALIGNLIVICWRVRDRISHQFHEFREEKQVNSTLLLSLACSDLLMGIYLICIAIADKYYRGSYIENVDYWRESIWCNLCGFFFTVSSHLSLFTLASIAYNRYNEICYPFSHHKLTLYWTHRIILIFFFAALIVEAIPYFRVQLYARSGVCLAFHFTTKRATDWLLISHSSFVFLLCICKLIALLYIVRCYIKIISYIVRAARENHVKDPNVYKILFIIIIQSIPWAAIIAMQLMSLINYPISAKVYSWIAVLVLPVNSAINPWFYIISNIWHKIKQYRNQKMARKSGMVAARPNHSISSYTRSNLDGPAKEMIPLTNAAPRQKLEQRNVPPGYVPVRQFIRQQAEQLDEDDLLNIALGIVSDIEEKHKEEKIYVTLNLDNVIVSNKVKLPVGSQQQEYIDGSTLGTVVEGSFADCNNYDNSTKLNSNDLTVFIADYNGYRFKRPKCSHHENHGSSSNGIAHQNRKFHRNRQLPTNCECADFYRLGDIIFKLIQLYNNSKLDQNGSKQQLALAANSNNNYKDQNS